MVRTAFFLIVAISIKIFLNEAWKITVTIEVERKKNTKNIMFLSQFKLKASMNINLIFLYRKKNVFLVVILN